TASPMTAAEATVRRERRDATGLMGCAPVWRDSERRPLTKAVEDPTTPPAPTPAGPRRRSRRRGATPSPDSATGRPLAPLARGPPLWVPARASDGRARCGDRGSACPVARCSGGRRGPGPARGRGAQLTPPP